MALAPGEFGHRRVVFGPPSLLIFSVFIQHCEKQKSRDFTEKKKEEKLLGYPETPKTICQIWAEASLVYDIRLNPGGL